MVMTVSILFLGALEVLAQSTDVNSQTPVESETLEIVAFTQIMVIRNTEAHERPAVNSNWVRVFAGTTVNFMGTSGTWVKVNGGGVPHGWYIRREDLGF